MTRSAAMPAELLGICRSWSSAMDRVKESSARREQIRRMLPDLLARESLFREILTLMAKGSRYPDLSKPEMFENEVLLYLDAGRRFSLRMFLFGPGEYTPIHDHSAWGIIGTMFGPLDIVTYERLDDGAQPGVALLGKPRSHLLVPGDTDETLPLDAGIHKTGNPGQSAMVMINVYGSPLRRSYVNMFDPEKDQVIRRYPPRIEKRRLAQAVLDSAHGA